MPITKSAKKALRVAKAKTEVNRRRKTAFKAALKGVSASTIAKSFSMIDKAAKWGIIEPNKAARLKSQLAKQVGSTPASDKPATTSKAKKAAAPKKTSKKKTAQK